jgi:hypothetical protein
VAAFFRAESSSAALSHPIAAAFATAAAKRTFDPLRKADKAVASTALAAFAEAKAAAVAAFRPTAAAGTAMLQASEQGELGMLHTEVTKLHAFQAYHLQKINELQFDADTIKHLDAVVCLQVRPFGLQSPAECCIKWQACRKWRFGWDGCSSTCTACNIMMHCVYVAIRPPSQPT